MIRSIKQAWHLVSCGRQRNADLSARLDKAIELHAEATEGVKAAAWKTVDSSAHVYETVRATLERMEKRRDDLHAAHP